jgi:hypothetical protein
MRTLLFFLLTISFSFSFAQNNNLSLQVMIDPATKPGYKQSVRLRAYLKNISAEAVKMSKPTPYVMWKTDDWDWNLSINGNPEKFFKFVERPDRRYASKDKLTLQPGDSVMIYVHQWDLHQEGNYQASFRYAQNKAMADESYVDKKQLEDRQDFSLVSNLVVFKVAKTAPVKIKEPLAYQDLLQKEIFYDNYISPAFLQPNEVYRLKIKKASGYKALEDFVNVQWVEIEAMDTDTVPDLISGWNLQSLTFYTAKKGNHYFPPSFAAAGNLRHLHYSNGLNSKMPAWVFKQTKLEYLRVFATDIKELDPCLFELKELKHLELNPASISLMPIYIEQLTKLETLHLMSVSFSDLSFLAKLPALKQVTIFGKDVNPKDPAVLALRARGAIVNINGWMQ